MRRLISKLFVIFCSLSIIFSSYETTKPKVVLIGIDGLLQRCLHQANNTAFEYLKTQGSYTFKARTAIEAVSAPGWSNILCGMDTESSGITDNGWLPSWLYNNTNKITPVTGADRPIPCIFEQLKKHDPSIKTVSLYSWDWLINFGSLGIPGSVDVDKFCDGHDANSSIICDDQMSEIAYNMIDEDFDFMFWYFNSLDEAGHTYGFCSDKYIDRLSAINSKLHGFFDKLNEKNLTESTHVIVVTDHGADYLGLNHGSQDNDNLIVPWFIMGPGIKKNNEILSLVKNLDTTSTITTLFNARRNTAWRNSQSIKDAFIKTSNLRKCDELEYLS